MPIPVEEPPPLPAPTYVISTWRSKWEQFWFRDPVAERLSAIAFRQKLFNLLAVLMFGASAALIYLDLEMLCDRAWEFTPLTREMSLFALLAVLGAALIVMLARNVFRKGDPRQYAQLVDRALGFEDDILITYFDLRRRKNLLRNEAEVADVLKEHVSERLHAVDVDLVVDARWTVRLLRAMGVLFGVLLVLYVAWGGSFEESFLRSVKPWRKIDPPRATRIIDVQPGDGVAVSDEPVKFTVMARGEKLPEWATLVYKLDGDSTELVERIEKAENGKYERQLPGFSRTVTYSVLVNTETKGPFHLKVVDRPLVTNVNARALPPAYAPLAPIREVEGGHVQAIAGSRVEIRAMANQPVNTELEVGTLAAWIQILNRRIPMTVQGSTLTGVIPATEDLEYQICYVGASGLTSREGVHYKLKVIPDQPPKPALARDDNSDSPVDPSVPVTVKATATDDLGLRKISLKLSVPGRTPAPTPIVIELSPNGPRLAYQRKLEVDLDKLALVDGDVVECVLTAVDVKPPKGQSADSAPLRIPILHGNQNKERIGERMEKADKADAPSTGSPSQAKTDDQKSSASSKPQAGSSSETAKKDEQSSDSAAKKSESAPSSDSAQPKKSDSSSSSDSSSKSDQAGKSEQKSKTPDLEEIYNSRRKS